MVKVKFGISKSEQAVRARARASVGCSVSDVTMTHHTSCFCIFIKFVAQRKECNGVMLREITGWPICFRREIC